MYYIRTVVACVTIAAGINVACVFADTAEGSHVDANCTKLANALLDRSVLLNAHVEVTAVAAVVDAQTQRNLVNFAGQCPLCFDDVKEISAVRQLLAQGHVIGLHGMVETIDSRKNGEYVAHWEVDAKWRDNLSDTVKGPQLSDMKKTAIVRKFSDDTYAVLLDDSTLALYSSPGEIHFPGLSTIDISLCDWQQMIRKGPIANQTISADLGAELATLTFVDSGIQTFTTQYSFNPKAEFAPDKVLSWREAKDNKTITHSRTFIYRIASHSPHFPVAFSLQLKLMGDGNFSAVMLFVRKWSIRSVDSPLERVNIQGPFLLLDDRYGQALTKEFGASSGARYVDDLIAPPR